MPRALFAQLGGFDSRYAPAYYEDTDLAFAVRAPASASSTSRRRAWSMTKARAGTDTHAGMKAYQVRNRERFARAVGASALAAHPAPGTLPSPADAARAPARRC